MTEQAKPMKVVEERSAEDYRGALDAVLSVAEGVLLAVPTPQIKVVGAAIGVAKTAASFAHDHHDVILEVAPLVAPAAEKAADIAKNVAAKAPDGVGRGAGKVLDVAKDAAGALGAAASQACDSVGGKVRGVADKHAQEKARKEARRTLLDGAGTRMPVKRFVENWSMQEPLSSGDYLNFAGCYVIATYGKAVKKDDYGEYRDVYVGQSRSMGRSIHDDIVGKGNPDVYADIKYDQDVYILLFPCQEEQLDRLEESLVVALDADASYNKA